MTTSTSSVVRLLASGALVATFAAATAIGCSVVSAVDFENCSENIECRDSFGLGWSCNADRGLCEQVSLHARCSRVEPAKLLEDVETHRTTFVIGTLFNDADVEGDQVLINSAKLAVREANAKTLDGRLFGLVHCDYQSNSDIDQLSSEEAAAELARFLVHDLGVNVIVGPGTSSTATAVYEAIKDTETLIISPSATANSLIEIDGANGTKNADAPGLFWRTAPPDLGVGAKMAELVQDGGGLNTVIVHETGSYGEGLALEVDRLLVEGGGTSTRFAFANAGSANILTNELNSEAFDSVVFVSAEVGIVSDFVNTVGSLIEDGGDSPYTNARVVVSDAAIPAQLIENSVTQPSMRLVFDQMFGVRYGESESESVYNIYNSRYRGEFDGMEPTPGYYGEHTYDATMMAVFGVTWATYQLGGELTARNIARGLWQINTGVDVSINSESLELVKEAFGNGQPVNLKGASGLLDYDPFTEETSAAVEAWRIDCTGDPCQDVVVGG